MAPTSKNQGKKLGKRQVAKRPGASPARSAKAPSSVVIVPVSLQKARRQRSATAAVSKGTTLMQTDQGPRAAWSASLPKFQKR